MPPTTLWWWGHGRHKPPDRLWLARRSDAALDLQRRPHFSVTPQTFAGTISGQIWLDKNLDNVQNLGDSLFTGGVLVTLLDCAGNPSMRFYTTTGSYSFTTCL